MGPRRSRRVTRATRTNFKGYEGRYVAVARRTRQVVTADRDPQVVLEKARGCGDVVVVGRVARAGEPIYDGLG